MKIAGVLMDHHYSGFHNVLTRVWSERDYSEIIVETGGLLLTFADCGIDPAVDDATLWRTCQERGYVLFSDNRNSQDSLSLESTIRRELRPTSLPVVTPGNRDRAMHDREYQVRIALSLAEVLATIDWQDAYLGVGRVYLPLASYG